MWSELREKLISRKFWIAVAGVVSGVAVIFGLDEGAVSQISGGIIAVTSVVIYIAVEGKIDAAAVSETLEYVNGTLDTFESDKED